MEKIMTILTYISHICSILFLIAVFRYIYLWFTGVAPMTHKIAKSLVKSKIAIFAKGEASSSLISLISDSKIRNKRDLLKINEDDIDKAAEYDIFLVHWECFGAHIDEILALKKDFTSLIIYAPFSDARIADEDMLKIGSKRNTTVTNFRGRLTSDILLAMISNAKIKK